jgi:hypothetical protein
MVGVVFAERGNVAVFDADMLAAGNINSGENSWRGDEYESFLREAVNKDAPEDEEARRVSILESERDVLRGTLRTLMLEAERRASVPKRFIANARAALGELSYAATANLKRHVNE